MMEKGEKRIDVSSQRPFFQERRRHVMTFSVTRRRRAFFYYVSSLFLSLVRK